MRRRQQEAAVRHRGPLGVAVRGCAARLRPTHLLPPTQRPRDWGDCVIRSVALSAAARLSIWSLVAAAEMVSAEKSHHPSHFEVQTFSVDLNTFDQVPFSVPFSPRNAWWVETLMTIQKEDVDVDFVRKEKRIFSSGASFGASLCCAFFGEWGSEPGSTWPKLQWVGPNFTCCRNFGYPPPLSEGIHRDASVSGALLCFGTSFVMSSQSKISL